MKFYFRFFLLAYFFAVSGVSAKDVYLQILDNQHIREVIIEYCNADGLNVGINGETGLVHKTCQIWRLDDDRLMQEFSRILNNEERSGRAVRGKPGTQQYTYQNINFSDDSNDLTVLESQMNRIFGSEWIPPLPERGTSHVSRKLVCPLLGCFLQGNRYIQRYEGLYEVKSLGAKMFKSQRCIKYAYSITGPFSTYFQNKGVLAEDESTALIRLHQNLTVTGDILVNEDSGIIYARTESIEFRVVEFQRVDLQSEWIKTKYHANISKKRTWTIESIKIVYK